MSNETYMITLRGYKIIWGLQISNITITEIQLIRSLLLFKKEISMKHYQNKYEQTSETQITNQVIKNPSLILFINIILYFE